MKGLRFNRRHLALLLLSAALLAFQISLLQILATSQWHHFAYMVISIALLGFGVAGTLLSLARGWVLERQAYGLPMLLCVCALTLAGALGMIQALFGGFDSYLLFVNAREALRLACSALLLMLPFTCGALAIGIIFTTETERIGGYYFANMFGSGIGCVLGLAVLASATPVLLPPLCGLVTVLAAFLLLPGGKRGLNLFATISLCIVAGLIIWPPELTLSQYKDLRRALALPGAKIIHQQPSSFGFLHVVSADTLRSASGLSLNWQNEMSPTAAVFVNADLFGSLPAAIGSNNPHNATTSALAFAIGSPKRGLVLNAATGQAVALAMGHGVAEITAVEPNRAVLGILTKNHANLAETAMLAERVNWQAVAPRTWLARDTLDYDLIMLPDIGHFGGSSGLFSLREQALLTREALRKAWQALTPNGLLSVTTWVDYPVRSPVRLLATLVEMLEDAGVTPIEHIAALRSWGTLTFCVKKTPLSRKEIAAARAFAERWAFDPALLPDVQDGERQRFNSLQDASLLELLDAMFQPEQRSALYRDYPFRLKPTSDNQPYFSQFLRWESLGSLIDQYGQRNVPFIELGVLVAGLAAVILGLLAVIMILLPLTRLRRHAGSRWKTLAYFGGLGLGYIWFELAMIHRFEYYLGQPVYAAALVVAVLLIGSAVGSAMTSRYAADYAARSARTVVLALCLYTLFLAPILQATIQLPFLPRAGISAALLAPAAFFMGMPFPLGMRLLNMEHEVEVPWAWGINGCLSVVGAAVATLIAVEAGYNLLLLLATGAYLLASLSKVSS